MTAERIILRCNDCGREVTVLCDGSEVKASCLWCSGETYRVNHHDGEHETGVGGMTYILFAAHCYYPNGGIDDYRGKFDTIEEAKSAFDAWCDEAIQPSDTDDDVWGQIATHEDMEPVSYWSSETQEWSEA